MNKLFQRIVTLLILFSFLLSGLVVQAFDDKKISINSNTEEPENPDPKPEPLPEPEPEPVPEPKPEPIPKPDPVPEPKPVTEPKQEPKTDTKPKNDTKTEQKKEELNSNKKTNEKVESDSKTTANSNSTSNTKRNQESKENLKTIDIDQQLPTTSAIIDEVAVTLSDEEMFQYLVTTFDTYEDSYLYVDTYIFTNVISILIYDKATNEGNSPSSNWDASKLTKKLSTKQLEELEDFFLKEEVYSQGETTHYKQIITEIQNEKLTLLTNQ